MNPNEQTPNSPETLEERKKAIEYLQSLETYHDKTQQGLNKFAKGKPLEVVDSDAAKLEALAHWFDVFDADDGSAGLANNEVQIDLRRIAQKLRAGQNDQESFDLLKRIIENFEIDGAVTKYHISEARDLIQKRERSWITRNTPKP